MATVMILIQDNQLTFKKQTGTLVYADVGPLSLRRQPHIVVDTPDDNRVVYADLNMQLESSSKLKEVKPALSLHMCDHAGVHINYYDDENIVFLLV